MSNALLETQKMSVFIWLSVVIFAAAVSLVFVWHSFLWRKSLIVFCDVGQGDAILLQHGSFQILVDAGQDHQVLECLQKHMPWYDQTIEILAPSHADSDHVGGFVPVLNNYNVREIWIAPFDKQSDVFTEFKQLVLRKLEQGTRLRLVKKGDVFQIGAELSVAVVAPNFDNHTAKNFLAETGLSDNFRTELKDSSIISEWGNDRSVVFFVRFLSKKIVLTGDIEKKTEEALTNSGLIPFVDLLKVAHHGSKTSSHSFFLDKVQPEVAVVSSGLNNPYGHPANETVASLERRGARVLRTDEEGDIVFEVTGEGLKLLH